MSNRGQLRIGDYHTGHDACSPQPLVTASNNVIVNDRYAGRVGDKFDTHGCKAHPSHQDVLIEGSNNVFINDLNAGRLYDSTDYGSKVAECSENVLVNN